MDPALYPQGPVMALCNSTDASINMASGLGAAALINISACGNIMLTSERRNSSSGQQKYPILNQQWHRLDLNGLSSIDLTAAVWIKEADPTPQTFPECPEVELTAKLEGRKAVFSVPVCVFKFLDTSILSNCFPTSLLGYNSGDIFICPSLLLLFGCSKQFHIPTDYLLPRVIPTVPEWVSLCFDGRRKNQGRRSKPA